MADPGTMAAPGRAITPGGFKLERCNWTPRLDESAIGTIHQGMKVQVAIDGAGSTEYDGETVCGRSCPPPASIESIALSRQRSTCLLQLSCAPACMETAEFANGFAPRAIPHVQRFRPLFCVGSLACAYVLERAGESRSFAI